MSIKLYSGSSSDFIELNTRNRLAGMLEAAFRRSGGHASVQEIMAWRNSLSRVSVLLQHSGLTDQGVMVEYALPANSGRIDFLIFGNDEHGQPNTVVVELKQWDRVQLTDTDSSRVLTWVAGGHKPVLHPSVQVGKYDLYLRGNLTAFYEATPVGLHSCSYLHNYEIKPDDVLLDPRFDEFNRKYPLYGSEDFDRLSTDLIRHVGDGGGMAVLQRVDESRTKPSPKLMKQVERVIRRKLKGELQLVGGTDEDYVLLDEQEIVYDTIMSLVKQGLTTTEKHVVIVKGGPGTGKSVIALKLLVDLIALKKHAEYASNSGSFTKTLRKIVGSEVEGFFKYFMSYSDHEPGSIDVLLLDEAHRLRDKTGYPFRATGRTQLEDLVRVCKIAVFLLDDLQVVRPKEVGRAGEIRSQAERLGCKVHEIQLVTQFRCAGSEAFINWVEHTLQLAVTANPEWVPDPNFEFKIFDSPESLDTAIRAKVSEGYSGRTTAGFCWPWTHKPNKDGSLVEDVVIGNYKRPWNANEKATGLKAGIPKSQFWAYDEGGIDQVGCIYTAQGFEFDYVGVIVGKDLSFDFPSNEWRGDPDQCFDTAIKRSSDFLELVKSTYRVLLTRGQKGCYVHFMDKSTENYFRSRIRSSQAS